MKKVFQITNTLLNKNKKSFPACDSNEHLSNKFADFFENKIVKIRTDLDNDSIPLDNVSDTVHAITVLNNFEPVDENEICKIISRLANKSCSLDILPTWMG